MDINYEQGIVGCEAIKTPFYIVDERLLIRNLETLESVSLRSGCKILLAQKGFSMFSVYPLIGRYLAGTTASSLFEARLGREEMGGEVHIFNPAFDDADFGEILEICDCIVFNSMNQWRKFRGRVKTAPRRIACGLRVNHGYSEVETELYNPCAPGSRLGIRREHLDEAELDGISGLHFHTMCEQGADVLERTLPHLEARFGDLMHRMDWINFGGGHHITRPGYDIDKLVACIRRIQDTYHVQVYLEPGEAIALDTGFLVASVLDVNEYDIPVAILDTSAACHMPDVLEMPYRPMIIGSGREGEKAHTYRLGGPTCLAGDVIGAYSFDRKLQEGDRLVFTDMAHYTMVKNNTFNGVNLPSIVLRRTNGEIKRVKSFGYEDFKGRLS
ncbi:MAG: carboxynorspermidine decarboxylase [Kiritimatiellia bacterium]|jgi:carboxynorspermidine decarboxylase